MRARAPGLPLPLLLSRTRTDSLLDLFPAIWDAYRESLQTVRARPAASCKTSASSSASVSAKSCAGQRQANLTGPGGGNGHIQYSQDCVPWPPRAPCGVSRTAGAPFSGGLPNTPKIEARRPSEYSTPNCSSSGGGHGSSAATPGRCGRIGSRNTSGSREQAQMLRCTPSGQTSNGPSMTATFADAPSSNSAAAAPGNTPAGGCIHGSLTGLGAGGGGGMSSKKPIGAAMIAAAAGARPPANLNWRAPGAPARALLAVGALETPAPLSPDRRTHPRPA